MKKQLFFLFSFLVFSILLVSCQETTAKEDTSLTTEDTATVHHGEASEEVIETTSTAEKITTPDSSHSLEKYLVSHTASEDILKIDRPCAIFIAPDSIQIEKLKKKHGEENFYVIADDVNWYNAKAWKYLEKEKLEVVICQNRYLEFQVKDKTLIFDTQASVSPGWIELFFQPDSLPEFISTALIEEEYKTYFKK